MKAIYSLLFLFISFYSRAGLLRIESNTYFAKRTGDDLKSEAPFYEEFQTNYLNEEKKLQFDFDFNYAYDFSRQVYNLDLNQLNIQADIPNTNAHVSLGRTFESFHLIKTSIVDSFSIDYKLLDDRFKTGVLLGVLRDYEFDKYKGKAPVYTWFSEYNTQENFPLILGLKLENSDYSEFSRSKYQTVKTTVLGWQWMTQKTSIVSNN